MGNGGRDPEGRGATRPAEKPESRTAQSRSARSGGEPLPLRVAVHHELAAPWELAISLARVPRSRMASTGITRRLNS